MNQYKISKARIGAAAQMLQKVINPKVSIPILENILCEVTDSDLKMTASDGEVTITAEVLLDETGGNISFCVPASELTSALFQLSEQSLILSIDLTDELSNMTITHSSGYFNIPILASDEYIRQEHGNFSEPLQVEADILRDAIKRCLWATTNDELRQVMMGVYFGIKDGELDIVGTDGRVVAMTTIPQPLIKDNLSMIIPKKVAALIAGMTSGGGNVDVRMSDLNGHIEYGDYTIDFRLIDGKYPNYSSVIPKKFKHEVSASRSQLIAAVSKVLPFATVSQGLIRVKPKDDFITMTVNDSALQHSASDSIPVTITQGGNIEIGLNASLLLNVMKSVPGTDTLIQMTDQTRAVKFIPAEQPEGISVTMVLSPMTLTEE